MWKAIFVSGLRLGTAYCVFVLAVSVFLLFAWPVLLLQRLSSRSGNPHTA